MSPRRRWDDNIKMINKDMGDEGVEWCHLAQDTVQKPGIVNMVMNLHAP